jgi:hypothetical protein
MKRPNKGLWNAWTRKHIIQFIFIQFISHVVSKNFQFLSSCLVLLRKESRADELKFHVWRRAWWNAYPWEFSPRLHCRENCEARTRVTTFFQSIFISETIFLQISKIRGIERRSPVFAPKDYKYNYFLIVFTVHLTANQSLFPEIYILYFITSRLVFRLSTFTVKRL